MSLRFERRVLVVDDDARVREAYRTVLSRSRSPDAELERARQALFDAEPAPAQDLGFELEFATQGASAVEALRARLERGETFAMAFLDMRMPPGWDGLHTAEELWKLDPDLQIVICSAYSDVSWEKLLARLGRTDRLLILKKPFEAVEAQQMAESLCEKRALIEAGRQCVGQLEEQVSARTRELAEALVQAEAATRAKSEFLANMSHEIRTPMTAVLGFANLLRDPCLAPGQRREYLETLRRNGDHLLAVLSDILDLSKIEAEQMLVEVLPTDAAALLSEVASLMRVKATEKELGFELVYEGPLPERIATDPTRLRQILLNLLGNAVKFTERGSVRVRVRVADPSGPAPSLVVAIEDSGPGIPEALRKRLFRAFQQGDTTTTRRFGGTGLGLLISKRLALLLGGDISVESTVGQGSTFTVTLPTGSLEGVRRIDCASEAAHSPIDAPEADLPQLRGRILLVEDGRDNQRLISLILRRAGAEVELANNGREGCELAETSRREGRPFDLILTDMQMPVMDGYETVRWLREAAWSGPIVALTAHAMTGDQERCMQAGCNAYETKPISRERLLSLCQGLLTAAPLPSSPPRADSPTS